MSRSAAGPLIEQYEKKPNINNPDRHPEFQPQIPFTPQHRQQPPYLNAYNGTPGPQGTWTNTQDTSYSASGFTGWSEEKVASLQSRLQKRLGPEYVSQRVGHGGGGKLRYVCSFLDHRWTDAERTLKLY